MGRRPSLLRDAQEAAKYTQPLSLPMAGTPAAAVARRPAAKRPLARDEIFGPVLSVIPYDSVDEACVWPTTTSSGYRLMSAATTSIEP